MPFKLNQQRLINQRISFINFTKPEELVSWFGAVQAQDYPGALWSIGLRLKNSTESDVEKAIVTRKIVRTWPMRGTLHFTAAEDVKWLLKLLTPKIISGNLSRLKRMGLDDVIFRKSRKIFTRALQGGNILTREELYDILRSAGLPVNNQLGIHILWKLAQEGLICFGPKSGKKFTFVLLDEWIPGGKTLNRDEALAEIAGRYFQSHGPATLSDFAWWTGLTLKEASAGFEMVKQRLEPIRIEDSQYWFSAQRTGKRSTVHKAYLLPGFDEYMVAYKDRRAILDSESLKSNYHGLVTPKIIIRGLISGTWKRQLKGNEAEVNINLFHPVSNSDLTQINYVVQQYSKFIGKKFTFHDITS